MTPPKYYGDWHSHADLVRAYPDAGDAIASDAEVERAYCMGHGQQTVLFTRDGVSYRVEGTEWVPVRVGVAS